MMQVLIVEDSVELGTVWQSHLERRGAAVHRVRSADEALGWLRRHACDVIVLNIMPAAGGALTVADYAS
jgi:DNA-binding response OmpR family regulator